MPKGKVHGKGGSKGHQSMEKHDLIVRAEAAEQRIARKQARRVRKIETRSLRQIDEFSDFTNRQLEKINLQMKSGQLTPNMAVIRCLALQGWYRDKMMGVVVIEADGTARNPTAKESDFLGSRREEWLRKLRGKMSEEYIQQQIELWKGRVGKPGY